MGTTKPAADSHAARRPAHPIARRATTANEYTAQVAIANRIFGSSIDIARRFGSFGETARAWDAHTTPTTTPIVRNSHPTATAREFMASSTCSDGSRV